MGMKSLDLIPDLERLPGDHKHRSFRETIEDLRAGEATLMAGEAVAAASLALWGIWDKVNVPDSLIRAYEAQYPREATKQSLLENWQEVQAEGPEAASGFISGLKGKLAEIRAAKMLEQEGYSNVNIARSSNQSTWDISAVNEVGEPVFFQVKTGAEGYASDVASDMGEAEVDFLVSSEIAAKVIGSDPGYADRLTDIGPDYELVVDVQDGLETLADNQGLDIPDSIGEAIPYVGGVVVAGRLIGTALKSEREFKDADRTTKNRIHVVRTLTMMSRFGITTVLTSAGAAGGSTLGFGLPGAIVGGTAGWIGSLPLNKTLRPHLLDLALDITQLTRDDLFYCKNKRRIDDPGRAFRERADALCGGHQRRMA